MIRHSAAHVLAQAVQTGFPDAKLGIGPPIKDGFYYDFDVARPFTPEDLADLDKRMRKIIKSGQRFSRRVVESVDDAKAELATEPYKLELVDLKSEVARRPSDAEESVEVGAGELTIYDNLHAHTGERIWSDLCRGPHVPTTRYIPAFKLTRIAAALLARQPGESAAAADLRHRLGVRRGAGRHLNWLAEAERRDHRRIGTELDLFSFPDEIGSGLAVFHPRGGIIRKELEDYVRQRHIEAGYSFVNTPHITKAELFHTSGHLHWYADGMFPPCTWTPIGDGESQARPGLLPQADELPDAQPDLPVPRPLLPRAAAAVLRVRHRLPLREVRRRPRSDPGARDDPGRRAHLTAPASRCADELASLLRFVLDCCADFGLERLLPGALDPRTSDKYVGSDEEWAEATATLERGGHRIRAGPGPRPGRRRVLRPQDLRAGRDALGRTWQMSTIQLDFNTPERFEPGIHRAGRHPAAAR